jgi:uncharacterized membrane protein YkvA (DUF1232 family)
MALRVTFDLTDQDLKFFRSQMKRAQETATTRPEGEIIAKVEKMVVDMSTTTIPLFVQQRVDKLRSLIDMLRDTEWNLGGTERRNVATALAYFADPHDLIPDHVPVLGYLDDAIMIELVVKELSHEIEAFEDFCRLRREEASRRRDPNLSREDYLGVKRRELHQRMRRRRSRRSSVGGARTRFRLF